MDREIERVLLTETELSERVSELGAQVTSVYRDKLGAEPLIAVGMLKGAFVFLADLVRNIELYCEIDFLTVSSYGNLTESSGQILIKKDVSFDARGRHILLVEDIVDSGYTMNFVQNMLRARSPASLALVSLLDKPSRRKVPVTIDYLGFSIPDEFVVGYGLDFAGRHRNLPYIGVLNPAVYGSAD